MKLIQLNIPYNINKHRHFCMSFDNPIIEHKDNIVEKGIGRDWVSIYHNDKKIDYDVKKDYIQAGLYDQIYGEDVSESTYDEIIDGDVFLLYDAAGLNYAHFFFDYFGKVLYYDEILKQYPNAKLAIPEDFYKEDGNSTFIKQWLNLYYDESPKNLIVLDKYKKYKISNLILPGCMYGFPMADDDNYIIDKIIETADKIKPIEVTSNGCYISRQDTLKRGWYHKRDLVNENELIEKIKSELKYDIIELMDYDIIGKIQIFKSYKNIIQQNSASNVNILFSNINNTNIILENPRLGAWMNPKLAHFATKSKTNLLILENAGEYITEELDPNQTDKGNYPWQLINLDGIIDVLKQIDTESI